MSVNLLIVKDLETFGAVAQLARASDCRSEGCGFEPHRPRFSDFCLVNTYTCCLISFGG
jgi:hypothetical protein